MTLVIALLAWFPLSSWAQDDDIQNKLSITTQLFLNELEGKIDISPDTKSGKTPGLVPVDNGLRTKGKNAGRIIAAPDTINGKAYISAFVRLNNDTDISELEALGVEIQEHFPNGLITTNIPVDKIREVAAIANVKRVSVAKLMTAFTNKARQQTNVDDVLTHSADAISAGLGKKYDGSGVILGVIDTGIDFNHIAFKDKNGNSRIKKAYVYNGSSAQEYSSITSATLTDDKSEDHGTHTSSTAGGSSVIVNGSNVTVTDDHSSATYGGMAPGADLYLAGINGLSDTYLANAVNKMVTYADQQGKPLVVSNSWGSQLGPHDGTGDVADVYNSLFGDSHPNRVALFASSNDAGKSSSGDGGGYHIRGTASSSSPLRSIMRCHYYSDTDDGYIYTGIVLNAWSRSTTTLKCKVHVLNSSTGAVVASSSEITPTANGATVSGLSSYYSGSLYAFKDYVEAAGKTQLMLYGSNFTTRSHSNYVSKYTLAIEVYPSSGSSMIDIWGGNFGYFTNHLSTSGYTWTAGSDDMCVSDEATIANVISIGAYVSNKTWKDYNGTSHTANEYTLGDIAGFSSYATAAESPTGLRYPWITAPGARLIAGVNHNHTTSVDSYSYYGSNFNTDLVVNSSTNPYAEMEGTSMATPTAAGIVTLWMQASLEDNAAHKNLTVNDVKTIMQETAIHDSYTDTGANASHFGNGKIDALAGIQYILGSTSEPTITAEPTSLTFSGYATQTQTQTVHVTGSNLTSNITATLSGSNVYSIDKNRLTQTNGTAEGDITVTWAPTAAGSTNATLTLSSTGAVSVTVNLTGNADAATPTIIADPTTLSFSAIIGDTDTQTFTVTGRFLSQDVTVTLDDANDVFQADKSSLARTTLNDDGSIDVTISFSSETVGSFTGTVTLSSAGAQNVVINLSATARKGGGASDAYLDIANYSSITETGWNTTFVNKFYKYTEYADDNVGWLTLPVYSAFVGATYAVGNTTLGGGHPQAWIETNVTSNSNTYAGKTWTPAEPLLGSSTYFTGSTGNGSPRAMGRNSSSNTSVQTFSFYVTNATAVKLLGMGNSGVDSTCPAAIKVFECTKNGNGTLTASTTATKSATSTSTSTTEVYTIGCEDLDRTKIYKVEASVYRGYLYEIGFQTPLGIPFIKAEPTSLAFETNIGNTVTKTFTVQGENLESDITASLTDANGVYSLDQSSVTMADAQNGTGKVLTVTYTPSAAGPYSGTVTLSSPGATSKEVALNGTVTLPVITAEPTSLAFEAKLHHTVSKSFTVTGTNLAGNITATLNDANGVFALDEANITVSDAEGQSGKTITVSFTPSEIHDYTATITLSSDYAEDVTISLNGTVLQPAMIVEPQNMQLKTRVGTTITANITLTAENLGNDVTAVLHDENNVYNIDVETITAEEAEAGKTIVLSFTPAEVTAAPVEPYSGNVTFISEGAATVTVTFVGNGTIPEVEAMEDELSLTTEAGTPVTAVFEILASELEDVVEVSIEDDAAGVFSVSPQSISIVDAEEGSEVTVTFMPESLGKYTGKVKLTTQNVREAAYVQLNGTATKKTLDSYDVTVDKYGYTTVWLDFPAAFVDENGEEYDDVLGLFYVSAMDLDGGNVTLTRIDDTYIPSSTGVVVMANSGTYQVRKTAVQDGVSYNSLLTGSDETTTTDAIGGSVLTLGKSLGYVSFSEYTGELGAYEAYLVVDGSMNNQMNSLKPLSLTFGPAPVVEEGIATYIFENGRWGKAGGDGHWYTLQGVRLNSRPLAPGLYIHNGRVEVVKRLEP